MTDLGDVVRRLVEVESVLISIKEELAWHANGSSANMILEELRLIGSRQVDIEMAIKRLER